MTDAPATTVSTSTRDVEKQLGDARPTEARMQEIVFPDHTNHLDTPFGGQVLAWTRPRSSPLRAMRAARW